MVVLQVLQGSGGRAGRVRHREGGILLVGRALAQGTADARGPVDRPNACGQQGGPAAPARRVLRGGAHLRHAQQHGVHGDERSRLDERGAGVHENAHRSASSPPPHAFYTDTHLATCVT